MGASFRRADEFGECFHGRGERVASVEAAGRVQLDDKGQGLAGRGVQERDKKRGWLIRGWVDDVLGEDAVEDVGGHDRLTPDVGGEEGSLLGGDGCEVLDDRDASGGGLRRRWWRRRRRGRLWAVFGRDGEEMNLAVRGRVEEPEPPGRGWEEDGFGGRGVVQGKREAGLGGWGGGGGDRRGRGDRGRGEGDQGGGVGRCFHSSV